MSYCLYQPRLTDEQADALNSGLCPHTAYLRLSSLDDDNAYLRVADALDYYRHTATVDATNPEEVFEVTNIGPEAAITRHFPMRSGSVGDVIIDRDTGAGYICASWGWVEMSPLQTCYFQTRVATVMMMMMMIGTGA